MSTHDKTLGAVTNRWESARQIHERLGFWSLITIRHKLRQLGQRGEIEMKIEPHPSGSKLFFRSRTVELNK